MIAARISAWVRRQPVLAFYLLAFAITWLGWIPQTAHSRGLFPFDSPLFYILGGVGPGLAAFIVMRVLRGKAGDDELLAPLLRWRVGVVWYAVALFGNAVIWLASLSIVGGLGTDLAQVGPVLALLPNFFIRLLAAIPEELGWRGFALPRLQSRYSALVSSLIIGILSALWHLPLLLNANNVMSTYPLILYFLYVIALTIVYTWLYNSARGSLLIVALFHAASNSYGGFLPVVTAVTWLVAAVIVIAFGLAHLPHRGKRNVQSVEY